MISAETTVPTLPKPATDAAVARSSAERLRWGLAVAAIALVAAVIATWPLLLSLTSTVPLGTEHESTVQVLNIWSLWWNADRAAQGFAGFWNAPFFFPAEGVFTFSEPQILIALPVAPLWGLGAPPALIYNLALLLMLTLNGVFTYRLARALEVPRLPALMGGILGVTLPFVGNMLGVLHLTAVFGILWTLEGLVRFGKDGSIPHVVWAATGFVVTYLTNQQYALMFAPFALAAGLVALSQQRFNIRSIARLTFAALVAGLVVLFVALPGLTIHNELGFTRAEQVVKALSARPGDFVTRPGNALVSFPPQSGEDTAGLFPGLILLGLAVAGAIIGRRDTDPGKRRWTVYLVGAVLGALLLALGLNIDLAGWRPFAALREIMPGMAELRSPFRYAAIMQAMLPLLAAIALAGLSLRLSHRGLGIATGIIVLVAGVGAAENLSIPAPLVEIPHSPATAWTAWLRNQPPSTVIAHIPFAAGIGVSDYELETWRMFAQIDHHKFIVNGYSGYFPPGYTEFQLDMASRFPQKDLLCQLNKSLEVDTLVIDQVWLASHKADIDKFSPYLTRVYSDEHVQIDRLQIPDGECVRQP